MNHVQEHLEVRGHIQNKKKVCDKLHRPNTYRNICDAFNVLVVVHFAADGAAHMWRIPAQALVAHGVLATADTRNIQEE